MHRLNADGSIGDMVDQRASLDAGFYAHSVYVMPSNRAVLLPTRGNEPEPGVHTRIRAASTCTASRMAS